ncbi:MAG: adenylyltransferase/cytidyltransferase family protein, partial [Symploca sp. SIO1B1]|nr:adenylyltransferase/cytidyltransferase family protein [Symploca sp. SIO1B1]
MRLFTTKAGLLCYLERHRQNQEVGLVPTMGSLHIGHLSLIERARQDNAIVVVSIFVNPLQFAPTEDFQEYPRQLDKDRQLCEQVGVDVIFAPSTEEMLPPNPLNDNTQVIPPIEMISGLCGR